MADYNTKVYHKQGGDELVVASGGAITIESGASLTVAGVTVDENTLAVTGLTASADELNILDGVTATADELNKLDDSAAVLTKGTGFALATTYASGVFREGGIIVTRILLDIEGVNEGGGAGDIIGDNGQANAHIGQITAALNGTIIGGRMRCLEVPTGGTVDIDLYSATEGTGTEDAAVSGLTETQLLNSGNWTINLDQSLTTLPAADEYLYLVGQATGDTAYTAGKFLIELYGVPA